MERLLMTPAPGGRMLKFVGDRVRFGLRLADGRDWPEGWQAFLRTNIGRGEIVRHQLIHAHTGKLKLVDASWRDIPMHPVDGGWQLDLPMTEAGYFRAKAYATDPRGWQYWPEGTDFGVSVHPDSLRTANTIYCAFVRMFGDSRTAGTTVNGTMEARIAELDRHGYTVIPASGKLRDLIRQLPHILETLGCRTLHLLPVHPTPTTYARFGRFGSPYAALDLTAIDPALVEFDKRTTGVDQFCELTSAVHVRGGRVLLDLVINHTGWGARLQETHPDWYARDEDGAFVSPGAWGVTWEDLAELNHERADLWENLADALLTWCRRGVDGFRCDAGYKIPVPAWQYIIARVKNEFPETIFLLEGLGGAWEATENLLTDGGMQWAYSELFQNYSGSDVRWYLDYCLRQCERVGLYAHYSETHDNNRLAAHAQGREWSLLRNRLCALTSANGGFGFTCGVEWLAAERINVHQCRGLNWGSPGNIVRELADLNRLLSNHPCFFDGANLRRLSTDDSPVYALSRVSAEGLDRVLVVVNTDPAKAHALDLEAEAWKELHGPVFDLLTRKQVKPAITVSGGARFELEAAGCLCLAHGPEPRGLAGEAYREARAQAAWALAALSRVAPAEQIGPYNWLALARLAARSPLRFLASLARLDHSQAAADLIPALEQAARTSPRLVEPASQDEKQGGLHKSVASEKAPLAHAEVAESLPPHYPGVVAWQAPDARRITLVPPDHWLLVEDTSRFRAHLHAGRRSLHAESVRTPGAHVACFPPGLAPGDATLILERLTGASTRVEATLRFLAAEPDLRLLTLERTFETEASTMAREPGLALLTNGVGGMARIPVDLVTVKSKYDCALAANLHPSVPVDRHLFVKRIRAWVVADGFISPLNDSSLIRFSPGPPAEWVFVGGAGDGRTVELRLTADMLPDRNITILRFRRPEGPPAFGRDLPADRAVNLTVRLDIVDRNFHTETHRNGDADRHFTSHCHPLAGEIGFAFAPAQDRQLRAFSDRGAYHSAGEWSHGVAHPIEASRGQVAEEDTFSPGWFELPMPKSSDATLTLSAEWDEPAPRETIGFDVGRRRLNQLALERAQVDRADVFGQQLVVATQAFLVRRGHGKTIIAGYPWFLDWGRDSLICARGLLAAGLRDEVQQLLETFGRFEEDGTLPNRIHGEDASNRDTSDAPLWYGVVCEEWAERRDQGRTASGRPLHDRLYATVVDKRGRTIADVLRSIAVHYRHGTPNGIRMDPASGLVYSPSHFTWMDTCHPAGTPREGYPVCIQVLWIHLLRQLDRLGVDADGESWAELAARAEASFHRFFWLDDRGWLADVLLAQPGQPAATATPDTALRCNGLLAITFGLLRGESARRCVEAAARHLLVPGALRSLAPLPVTPPLPIHAPDGRLLNNPNEPYWGRYEGDEDTQRKPAYHNGTAWTWTFPTFCEALARAWNFEPGAVKAALAYLGSMDRLLVDGCLGHLPEIVDGDTPHTQRGCDAQAWGVTETLRVWRLLRED